MGDTREEGGREGKKWTEAAEHRGVCRTEEGNRCGAESAELARACSSDGERKTHFLAAIRRVEGLIAKETTIVLAQHVHGFVLDGILCSLHFFFSYKKLQDLGIKPSYRQIKVFDS